MEMSYSGAPSLAILRNAAQGRGMVLREQQWNEKVCFKKHYKIVLFEGCVLETQKEVVPNLKSACHKKMQVRFQSVISSSETAIFLQESGIWGWHRLVSVYLASLIELGTNCAHCCYRGSKQIKEAASETTIFLQESGFGGVLGLVGPFWAPFCVRFFCFWGFGFLPSVWVALFLLLCFCVSYVPNIRGFQVTTPWNMVPISCLSLWRKPMNYNNDFVIEVFECTNFMHKSSKPSFFPSDFEDEKTLWKLRNRILIMESVFVRVWCQRVCPPPLLIG